VRASGIGREAGIWGIRAFQEIKSISGAALAEPDD
jgi:aldehyde dehydrogenase (NAD+)